ncbi:MAG: hypothetical protein II364_03445 [Bacteroidales bacterium]|nr:hypothetical protein [Bacteroidales bacterium]
MKRIFTIITLITAIVVTSCVKKEYVTEVNNDFTTNYEVFWNYVNENYCFLGNNYGYTKNVDWHAVYNEMMPQVKSATTEMELLEIMGKSIDYLKDGHVWIDTKFKHRGCKTFYYDENGVKYPENYISGVVAEKYLDYPFKSRNGHVYGTITRDGKSFFYVHHADFTKIFNAEDLELFKPLIKKSSGIIYDIRTNPGGSAQYSLDMAGRFIKEKMLVGYQVVKSGKGYNDLTEPMPLYMMPVDVNDNWADIETMVLTNRDVYSTANMFASFMKLAPKATLVGGITGGGGGQPTSYYLPNGWTVTMSAQRMSLDLDKVHIEPGVKPDIEVNISDADMAGRVDSILEKALDELLKK